jgi:hypothetical protein
MCKFCKAKGTGRAAEKEHGTSSFHPFNQPFYFLIINNLAFPEDLR